MGNKSFSYSGVIGFGWRMMMSNFWFFVGVGVVSFLIPLLELIAGGLIMALYPKIASFWFFVLLGVIFITIVILIIGLIKITLGFCDGQKPRFGTLFSGWDCFWRFLAAGILYNLILNGTYIACILPFLLLSDAMHNPFFALPISIVAFIVVEVLSIKFVLCFYFVIDKGLGPIDALKASSMATTEAKGSLFIFFILCGLINFLGSLCIVGVFATFPTIMVAMALVYRHLSERTPELAELGIRGPNAKPRLGTEISGSQTIGGMQFASVIKSVVNARPDQSIQSRAVSQPAGSPQSAGGMQDSPAVEAGPSIRLGQGVQLSPVIQPSFSTHPPQGVQTGQDVHTPQGAQPSEGIRAAIAIQREGEKKTNNSLIFWVAALVVLSVALAGVIGYRFWPRPKAKVVVSSKKVVAALKEVKLKGILYSKDKPLVLIGETIAAEGDIIDGVKVVKVHEDKVEFEKDGVKWTQRAK